jgi:hypothetical protein
MDTDLMQHSKHLEIDNSSLTKMKFFLNEDDAWVPKDQTCKEEHDEKDGQVGDDEFANMFETPPSASFPKDVGTNS